MWMTMNKTKKKKNMIFGKIVVKCLSILSCSLYFCSDTWNGLISADDGIVYKKSLSIFVQRTTKNFHIYVSHSKIVFIDVFPFDKLTNFFASFSIKEQFSFTFSLRFLLCFLSFIVKTELCILIVFCFHVENCEQTSQSMIGITTKIKVNLMFFCFSSMYNFGSRM